MINWKDMEVLIAGGAGMIGSHLAEKLVWNGARVTIADNLMSGSAKNFNHILHDISFAMKDLRDYENCLLVTRGKDYVFQLAANMGGINYISTVGADIMRDSVLINANMLEAAVKNSVEGYFFSSSACVYPEYRQKDPVIKPLAEADAYPAQPDQYYGWEKLFTEQMCEAYCRDYGLNVKIARFHNVYGTAYTAYDRKKAKAPCMMTLAAVEYPDNTIEIWGDGLATRSYLYIDDCIRGILQLMDSDYHQPVNIGSDHAISVNDLARKVIVISGKDIEPKRVYGKAEGVRGRNADLTLIKELLGWEPEVDLDFGLRMIYLFADENYRLLEGIN